MDFFWNAFNTPFGENLFTRYSQISGPVPPSGSTFLITEDENFLITEDGNFLVTE